MSFLGFFDAQGSNVSAFLLKNDVFIDDDAILVSYWNWVNESSPNPRKMTILTFFLIFLQILRIFDFSPFFLKCVILVFYLK